MDFSLCCCDERRRKTWRREQKISARDRSSSLFRPETVGVQRNQWDTQRSLLRQAILPSTRFSFLQGGEVLRRQRLSRDFKNPKSTRNSPPTSLVLSPIPPSDVISFPLHTKSSTPLNQKFGECGSLPLPLVSPVDPHGRPSVSAPQNQVDSKTSNYFWSTESEEEEETDSREDTNTTTARILSPSKTFSASEYWCTDSEETDSQSDQHRDSLAASESEGDAVPLQEGSKREGGEKKREINHLSFRHTVSSPFSVSSSSAPAASRRAFSSSFSLLGGDDQNSSLLSFFGFGVFGGRGRSSAPAECLEGMEQGAVDRETKRGKEGKRERGAEKIKKTDRKGGARETGETGERGERERGQRLRKRLERLSALLSSLADQVDSSLQVDGGEGGGYRTGNMRSMGTRSGSSSEQGDGTHSPSHSGSVVWRGNRSRKNSGFFPFWSSWFSLSPSDSIKKGEGKRADRERERGNLTERRHTRLLLARLTSLQSQVAAEREKFRKLDRHIRTAAGLSSDPSGDSSPCPWSSLHSPSNFKASTVRVTQTENTGGIPSGSLRSPPCLLSESPQGETKSTRVRICPASKPTLPLSVSQSAAEGAMEEEKERRKRGIHTAEAERKEGIVTSSPFPSPPPPWSSESSRADRAPAFIAMLGGDREEEGGRKEKINASGEEEEEGGGKRSKRGRQDGQQTQSPRLPLPFLMEAGDDLERLMTGLKKREKNAETLRRSVAGVMREASSSSSQAGAFSFPFSSMGFGQTSSGVFPPPPPHFVRRHRGNGGGQGKARSRSESEKETQCFEAAVALVRGGDGGRKMRNEPSKGQRDETARGPKRQDSALSPSSEETIPASKGQFDDSPFPSPSNTSLCLHIPESPYTLTSESCSCTSSPLPPSRMGPSHLKQKPFLSADKGPKAKPTSIEDKVGKSPQAEQACRSERAEGDHSGETKLTKEVQDKTTDTPIPPTKPKYSKSDHDHLINDLPRETDLEPTRQQHEEKEENQRRADADCATVPTVQLQLPPGDDPETRPVFDNPSECCSPGTLTEADSPPPLSAAPVSAKKTVTEERGIFTARVKERKRGEGEAFELKKGARKSESASGSCPDPQKQKATTSFQGARPASRSLFNFSAYFSSSQNSQQKRPP
uniref:Uncharacterized protein n=1 Tax=Chromera velia CCMP2878 TaxID=1169474 RepID=A0A0G4FHG1_9ALVE|eukprot:Cvel_3313.t1-p1 / transcript=Cvel_3313.t1 / gene=Cvel_3313 / organism=Chromera_velia_CCMP2878 / gene_product=hypothetical protein / transcript_product=hypothetical protein / location=Cvel_scaffold131:93390-98898(+) / protein_length=1131 / sequence_SO=supercontig / SO=protein_coding / is_pseudo=false